MLRFLRIARLAVIDAVDVEFQPGFNVLTGETGAGKSILVGAVGLLLGGRASADLVRTGEEVATVEAIFGRGDHEIVIRREVTAQGRSRAFIDGTLVTAGALKDLAGELIELHGQHEHQTLLDPATHLTALDAFGGLAEEVRQVGAVFNEWQAKLQESVALRTAARDRAARLDFAAFQLSEIDKVGPAREEDETLTAARQVLANAARVERLCAESYAALYESDDAVLAALSGVWKRVGELAVIDPVFEPYVSARDGIKAQLEDLAAFLRRYVDTLDISPSRLQQVEERLASLERLKRKFGPTLALVLQRRDELVREVADLEGGETRLEQVERDAAALRSRFVDQAERVSARRRDAARTLTPRLVDLLADLALDRTRFEARFNDQPIPETEWGPLGVDRLEFFISPNPGEELRPLSRIASGGELSRVMLALKTLTFRSRVDARHISGEAGRLPGVAPPGMIFDEVDAGIGGAVADVVGRRLRGLGSTFQVLCITHLPQVAAHADTHFLIEKHVTRERTETRVARLTPERRVDELARMLAGSAITDASRASARELLSESLDGRRTEAKGELKTKGESERAAGQTRRSSRGA
jgi:DNA repair protein RecN (Recombination protein N)